MNEDDMRQTLKPIPYVVAKGATIDEMREKLLVDPEGLDLLRRGDVMLVWVTEADIVMQDLNIWVYNQNLQMGTLDDPEDGI